VSARLLGAAVVTWLGGLLIAVHGVEGVTRELTVLDIVLAGALLAILMGVVHSRVRSRRSHRNRG
jgi:hypothetical protein